MVKLTQSLEVWLATYHRDLYVLITFGHIEVFTAELQQEYLEWCLTDEGRRYLKGGDKYDESHDGNSTLDKIREE